MYTSFQFYVYFYPFFCSEISETKMSECIYIHSYMHIKWKLVTFFSSKCWYDFETIAFQCVNAFKRIYIIALFNLCKHCWLMSFWQASILIERALKTLFQFLTVTTILLNLSFRMRFASILCIRMWTTNALNERRTIWKKKTKRIFVNGGKRPNRDIIHNTHT